MRGYSRSWIVTFLRSQSGAAFYELHGASSTWSIIHVPESERTDQEKSWINQLHLKARSDRELEEFPHGYKRRRQSQYEDTNVAMCLLEENFDFLQNKLWVQSIYGTAINKVVVSTSTETWVAGESMHIPKCCLFGNADGKPSLIYYGTSIGSFFEHNNTTSKGRRVRLPLICGDFKGPEMPGSDLDEVTWAGISSVLTQIVAGIPLPKVAVPMFCASVFGFRFYLLTVKAEGREANEHESTNSASNVTDNQESYLQFRVHSLDGFPTENEYDYKPPVAAEIVSIFQRLGKFAKGVNDRIRSTDVVIRAAAQLGLPDGVSENDCHGRSHHDRREILIDLITIENVLNPPQEPRSIRDILVSFGYDPVIANEVADPGTMMGEQFGCLNSVAPLTSKYRVVHVQKMHRTEREKEWIEELHLKRTGDSKTRCSKELSEYETGNKREGESEEDDYKTGDKRKLGSEEAVYDDMTVPMVLFKESFAVINSELWVQAVFATAINAIVRSTDSGTWIVGKNMPTPRCCLYGNADGKPDIIYYGSVIGALHKNGHSSNDTPSVRLPLICGEFKGAEKPGEALQQVAWAGVSTILTQLVAGIPITSIAVPMFCASENGFRFYLMTAMMKQHDLVGSSSQALSHDPVTELEFRVHSLDQFHSDLGDLVERQVPTEVISIFQRFGEFVSSINTEVRASNIFINAYAEPREDDDMNESGPGSPNPVVGGGGEIIVRDTYSWLRGIEVGKWALKVY
ncbi:hypothetical protein HDU76_004450 [Blyttiomyces sp. JEL0837]|nr:hypothetical protein HDU76_004450 [Blyttiomyces sp. JEL0837]